MVKTANGRIGVPTAIRWGLAEFVGLSAGSALLNPPVSEINRILDYSSWLFLIKSAQVFRTSSNEWLTTEQAADYLGTTPGVLRNLSSNGHVPYYKVPGTRSNRYRVSELRELLINSRRGATYGI